MGFEKKLTKRNKMAFTVDLHEHQGSVVFLLKGKLTQEGDALSLNDTIDKELSRGMYNVIFDLSELKNCNSSGLNSLIRTLTKTRTHGGDTVVCHVNPSLEKLFSITKLNEIFSLYSTQKEALQHFKK
jgi:anti-anti-sigma factor